jgi:hypothetical protein
VNVTTVAPLAAGIITAAAQMANGQAPRLRIGIAAVAGAVMLSLFGAAAPAAARAFAWLILLGAMLGPGVDVIRALGRLIG